VAQVKKIEKIPDPAQAVLDQEAAFKRRGFSLSGRFQNPDNRVVPGRPFSGPRLSTVVSTEQHLRTSRTRKKQSTRNIINCWVNPYSIDWSFPLRVATQETLAGEVAYTWRRRPKVKAPRKLFGIGTANITFQTGSIYSRETGSNDGDVPPGLDDYYTFLRLVNEPLSLPDGSFNHFVVIHTSALFPTIILKGVIAPEGVTCAESAEGNYSQRWTATLRIYQTIPDLTRSTSLLKMFGAIG